MVTRTWSSYFVTSKFFRLHAILHVANGALRARSAKGPGYFYMIGGGPNSCLLGQVTTLLFCFHVKLILPNIFNSVDFWSSMSCIVPDNEPRDINVNREREVFLDGKVQGHSACPLNKCKTTKQAVWCTRKLHGIVWNSRHLDYTELPNILPSDVGGGNFAESTEKCKILGSLVGKLGYSWLSQSSRSRW